GATHQPVDIRQLVGHVIERRPVVAEDRDAVVVRTAAQELHHVRGVGELEAESVDEKRNLIVGARAVEDDVTDLGRPRAVHNRARMLHEIGGYAHGQPVGRAKAKAVAAAGAAIERSRIALDVDAITLRLGAERIDRGAVIGGEMHAEERRLWLLPDGEHVMLAAGGAEMHAVALCVNLFERPNLGVELRRLMKIADAELDAANSGNSAIRHGWCLLPSPGPMNFAQSAAKG